MSLFPAYNPTITSDCEKNEEDSSKQDNDKQSNDLLWLQNESYVSVSNQRVAANDNKDSSSHETEDHDANDKKKKKKKKKHKNEKHSRSVTNPEHQKSNVLKIKEDDPFYEDKKQDKCNFLVNTLHRPSVPRYNKDNCYFKEHKMLVQKTKESKNKSKRYFRPTSEKRLTEEEYDIDQSVKEEELTMVTEDFNKRLSVNPRDVKLWLEYVRFQDTIYEFEKAYRNNPIGGDKVTYERKLAILVRALKSNPQSHKLLEEKLALCERFLPGEQLATEHMKELAKDPGNLILWRALVRTSRNSMARCTVPGVLKLYTQAVSRINSQRAPRTSVAVEQDLITLLLDCGLFLQEAGLWEQLCTLLQMHLSLSLTVSGSVDITFDTLEDKLREDEDSVVTSGLPLSVLWCRVEKLRAACHFLPNNKSESDPQRIVFTDDMTGLFQPLITPELRLPLVVVSALLLKVPLLPTQHSILTTIGLHESLSNIEALLPAVIVHNLDCKWLNGTMELVSEPQYVRSELYLEWLFKVLQFCADLLPTDESVLIHCWLLRFYGLLCRMNSIGLATIPPSIPKKARAHAKQLLKSPNLRDNLVLFTEYAMMESNLGDIVKACKVLETAVSMAPTPKEPSLDHVYLCRRLVQCLLQKDFVAERDHAVDILVALGNCEPLSTAAGGSSEVQVKKSLAQWQRHTSALVIKYIPEAEEPLIMSTLTKALTPHLLVEWLSCHAFLMALTLSIYDAKDLLLQYIELIPSNSATFGWLWVEQLYEVLVEILHSHCCKSRTGYSMLREILRTAILTYPNNLTLLSTIASLETCETGGGSAPWKLVSYFPPSAPLASLVLVLVVRYRVSHRFSGDERTQEMTSPYLRSVLVRMTDQPVTGQSPLVWRLYLQLIAASGTPSDVKQAFYRCVNVCPWVKTLYMDAIEFLPDEMSEILDLIVDKELRLHVTSEELEVLRD